MEQTILNPKFLLSAILALSLIMISSIVLILHLYRRINILNDYCDALYSRDNLLDKYQKEDHDVMVKLITTSKDINANCGQLIEYNKELIKSLEQKSK